MSSSIQRQIQMHIELWEAELQQKLLKEQTEMFWYLQLQFMARSSRSLADAYQGIRYGQMYVRNAHSAKMERLLGIDPFLWSEEDHNCLATHLALQLSGMEE